SCLSPAVVLLFLLALASAPLPDAPHVLGFLNRTIGWYDRLDAEARLADQPTDVLYLNDNRQLAHQVVTLSFEFAKADAQLIANPATPAPTDRAQRMQKRAASAAEQLKREQERLAALQAQSPRNDAAIAEA